MGYLLSYVEERDTDFALMREMSISHDVQELFFKKVNVSGVLFETYHSLVQKEKVGKVGESDIVFVFQKEDGSKFAIFIEDKIAADAQPEQRNRYNVRANKFCNEKGIKDYYVVLFAPQVYLDKENLKYKNNEKNKAIYDIQVSHEEVRDLCKDELDRAVFIESCNAKKKYTKLVNEEITKFWDNLIDYISEKYTDIKFPAKKEDRGDKSAWVEFPTGVKGLYICYKSNLNCIDLTFTDMGKRKTELINILNDLHIELSDRHIITTKNGRSLIIRKELPSKNKTNFGKDFDEQIENIDFVLYEVRKMLNEIVYKIENSKFSHFPI